MEWQYELGQSREHVCKQANRCLKIDCSNELSQAFTFDVPESSNETKGEHGHVSIKMNSNRSKNEIDALIFFRTEQKSKQPRHALQNRVDSTLMREPSVKRAKHHEQNEVQK